MFSSGRGVNVNMEIKEELRKVRVGYFRVFVVLCVVVVFFLLLYSV